MITITSVGFKIQQFLLVSANIIGLLKSNKTFARVEMDLFVVFQCGSLERLNNLKHVYMVDIEIN